MTAIKQAKVQAILRSVMLIGAYYHVNLAKIICPKNTPNQKVKIAKGVLVYHLHYCGMSYEQIARVIHRSIDITRRYEQQGARRFLNWQDRAMIERLPRIPTTLNISKA